MKKLLPIAGLVVAVLPLSACGGASSSGRTSAAQPVAARVSATADRYKNYADLARHEKEGRDYLRVLRPARASHVAQIAIHGGGIEPPTTQLADYAARTGKDGFYSFEGIKKSGNTALHITSTHFDEPRALNLQKSVRYTVSWHAAKGDTATTYVGGRDTALSAKITRALRAKGFRVSTPPGRIDGGDPRNICNRNARGKGVQLEITTAQRKAFFKGGRLDAAWIADPRHRTAAFYNYVRAVNSVLASL
ncbi:poly-gamma-glutamate hydrolase family protein [Actinomadura oligospora]|uniref:poly-gamma-glutamate hydrolase family protein n=1 Tax=Actinomadura oligospora TaxID=111804 RepID=UPI0004B963CC|nr:poly-gamma-glutamate hydrolase family protein [Actinomadura oligospora]